MIVKLAKQVWWGLDVVWQGVALAAAAICFLLVVIQIILRYVLEYPLMGTEEVVCMVAFWAYFMGGVHGAYEGSHIQAEISQAVIKNQKTLQYVYLLKNAITFAIAFYISIWALDYFLWGLQRGERSPFLLIPRAYGQSAISLGLALMALYFFADLVKSVNGIVAGRRKSDKN